MRARLQKTVPALNGDEWLALSGLTLILALLLLFGHRQVLTGDEPRYLMYAVSILKNGRYVMTLPEWQQLYLAVTRTPTGELPAGANNIVLLNAIYVPTVLAPIAAFFSLSGLRVATLITGLAGLFFLYRLCRRFSPPGPALLATVVAGFTIPLLPYLHLFYMEAFLFALVACGWDRVQEAGHSARYDALTAFVLLAIPFVQMRGSVVAAALYLLLLWQLYASGLKTRAIALTGSAVVALAALCWLNYAIYGAITGPVNTARPPLPSQWFPVLSMQLFNIRHGLFAYAPIWLLGYAGLWAGAINGPPIVRQGLVLASIAAITSVGVNPGECWPARFWVLAVPMLSVGLCCWWTLARKSSLRWIAIALIALTLVNTALFFWKPNDFLDNRQSTKTYQTLFDRFGQLDFGLVLPVEVDDAQDVAAARNLALGAGLFIVLTAAAARTQRLRWAYAAPAVLLLIACIDLARVRVMEPPAYQAQIDPKRLGIDFGQPVTAGYIQFGHAAQTWSVPPDWPRFSATYLGTAGEARLQFSADQVVPFSCVSGVTSVTIESSADFDLAAEAGYKLTVYQSRSILRGALSALRNPC